MEIKKTEDVSVADCRANLAEHTREVGRVTKRLTTRGRPTGASIVDDRYLRKLEASATGPRLEPDLLRRQVIRAMNDTEYAGAALLLRFLADQLPDESWDQLWHLELERMCRFFHLWDLRDLGSAARAVRSHGGLFTTPVLWDLSDGQDGQEYPLAARARRIRLGYSQHGRIDLGTAASTYTDWFSNILEFDRPDLTWRHDMEAKFVELSLASRRRLGLGDVHNALVLLYQALHQVVRKVKSIANVGAKDGSRDDVLCDPTTLFARLAKDKRMKSHHAVARYWLDRWNATGRHAGHPLKTYTHVLFAAGHGERFLEMTLIHDPNLEPLDETEKLQHVARWWLRFLPLLVGEIAHWRELKTELIPIPDDWPDDLLDPIEGHR